ncbi:MAG TPA: hypothetical protein VFK13_13200 [Gemmatimonadaceae bacterium]|nr:hypothetical protein [Gemmatimonadaceae bacterium]
MAPLDDLWPGIQSRIEERKVLALDAPARRPVRSRGLRVWLPAAVVAAALAIVFVARTTRRPAAPDAVETNGPAYAVGARSIDSAAAYRQQVTALLEELELRRAILRPDVVSQIDHDVKVIDDAIAELQEALKHDPDNAALRQLLAASYRQKRDLLERVRNAS